MTNRAPAIVRNWNTPEMRAKAAEHQGRPVRLVGGSWISDLASLGKAVMLCVNKCAHRWDPAAYNYQRRVLPSRNGTVSGQCDGCREGGGHFGVKCAMFVPKR